MREGHSFASKYFHDRLFQPIKINVKNSLTDQTENVEMQRERLGQACC